MNEIRYTHVGKPEDYRRLRTIGKRIREVVDNIDCVSRNCKEKHLIILLDSFALAMQGVTLKFVCHVEYLNAINANLPNWLQLCVRDS